MKVNLNWLKSIALLLVAIVYGVFWSSCKKNNDADPTQQSSSGYVTFINAATNPATQDFFVDNVKVNNSALGYTQSTGYIPIKTGGHKLQVKSAANSTLNNTSTFSVTAPFYTSIFYLEDKSTLVVDDSRTAPPSGQCSVRFINLSTGISIMDFGVTNGAKFLSGLDYTSCSPYYNFTPGTTFILYLAGTKVILKSLSVTLTTGHLYTIYLTGITSSAVNYQLLTLD